MNVRTNIEASRRIGFTLIELLIVMAVIGVLVALLLPAVMQCRERARRLQCASNLTQFIIAVNHYQGAHGVYPPGTIDVKGPVLNARLGYHHNWLVQSLPFLEMRNAYAAVDSRQSIYHVNNKPLRNARIGQFNCPSDSTSPPQTSYAACHHDTESPIDVQNNGVFFLNSRVRPRDIKDGAANTIFLGEKITDAWDMEWTCGTRATLRNTGSPINFLTTRNGGLPMGAWGGTPYDGTLAAPADMLDVPGLESDNKPADPASSVTGVDASKTGIARSRLKAPIGTPTYVGGFGSAHPSGANFAFGDGSIRYLNEQLSLEVLQQLGHRADGQLPPEF